MGGVKLMSRVPVPWGSRGIGLDGNLVCFVCGAKDRDAEAKAAGNPYMHNIAAHLGQGDEAAALACFAQGARMAYYHGDPEAPQIKVGACTAHLPALEFLSKQWFISAKRVEQLAHLHRWMTEQEKTEERPSA